MCDRPIMLFDAEKMKYGQHMVCMAIMVAAQTKESKSWRIIELRDVTAERPRVHLLDNELAVEAARTNNEEHDYGWKCSQLRAGDEYWVAKQKLLSNVIAQLFHFCNPTFLT